MGCASSKHRKRCRNCRGELSRSYSMHVHHPPQHSGDSHHTVALTSSTIGSSFSHTNTNKHLELMEGLEDVSPSSRSQNHLRSFSFDVVRDQPSHDDCPNPKSRIHDDNVRLDDLDPPEIVSTFGPSDEEKEEEKEDATGKSKSVGKNQVILYFTTLRGIRKTYEDSCNVRMILKSLGIRLDERDVSLHLGFREELKELLRNEFKGNGITLPRAFLGNKYLGGVEEIKKFNENGTLEKLIEGCEKVGDGFTGCRDECGACGDVRFVPCETCSGSCKVYYEDEQEETESGFQRCPDCNENGLISCPVCSV